VRDAEARRLISRAPGPSSSAGIIGGVKIVSVMTTDSSGGAEFAAVEMLEALRQRGHDTVMLTDMPGMARDTAVRVSPVAIGPKLSKGSWIGLALRWPRLLAQLRRALRAQAPYDVLMVHYKKEQLLAGSLPADLRRTVVWAEWGPVPFPLRRGLPRRAYLRAGERAALVMAISEGTRRSVAEVGVPDEKIIVVPNVMRADDIRFTEDGRSRVRAQLGIPPQAFVVGCISRFHPKKRNDVVVRAVIALADPRAHLILAGSGETEAELRRLAEPLGERVHFIATPGAEVPEVLSAFDVSVFCPSPTEGAPRAVILGMLASRPCLSTGAEGVADMIMPEFGGIASPENDPDSLLPLIRRYIDDPDRVTREGAVARAHAERTYAAPVVAERIERLLEGAIGGDA
jgi:glycosyltransferase involved in cell wall biosynthesis